MLLLALPLIGWAALASKKHLATIDQAWRRAAELLEGQFDPGERALFGSKPRRIVAHVDGIDIVIDHYQTGSGNSRVDHTRLQAAARAPTKFRLSVAPAHAFSGIATALGFQDVEIGHAGFDADYVIKTNDPEAARLWINATVRKHIKRASGYRFDLENNQITAEIRQLELDAAHIVAAAKAVAAFADGRQRLLRAWRELARRQHGKVKSRSKRWATIEYELDGTPIVIDTRTLGGRHYTFATAQVLGATLTPFVLANDETFMPDGGGAHAIDELSDYLLSSDDVESVNAHLGGGIAKRIAEFAPAAVSVESDEVVVTWPGICLDPKELEQASGLAAAVASGPARGPYR